MDIKHLVNASSKAWSLAILRALYEGTPGRQASLIAQTGAGRTAFSPSLYNLVDLGLVQRCAGHGHPLRPEFELTGLGQRLGALATELLSLSTSQAEVSLMRKAWTVPVLGALAEEDGFGEVRHCLSPITDRALSQSLKALESVRWVERGVEVSSRPPRPFYLTQGTGTRIAEAWLRHRDARW